MSSFRAWREAQEYAGNQMAEMMDSTIALIRPKNVRWINLLAANTEQETKNLIASGSFAIMTQLIKKQEQSARAKISVRMIYPMFDPEEHFGTITRDELDRVVKFVPVKYDASLHKDIVHARDIWEICIRHRELVDGYVRSLEIFADGLWELTGTALVKRMTDFSGRVNYAIDRSVAGDITRLFPAEVLEEKIEEIEDESEESEEVKDKSEESEGPKEK